MIMGDELLHKSTYLRNLNYLIAEAILKLVIFF